MAAFTIVNNVYDLSFISSSSQYGTFKKGEEGCRRRLMNVEFLLVYKLLAETHLGPDGTRPKQNVQTRL